MLGDPTAGRKTTVRFTPANGSKLHKPNIWSATDDDYRGYAGADFRSEHRGKRTVIVFGRSGTSFQLLDHLTDAEISEKLPVQLRHLPLPEAA